MDTTKEMVRTLKVLNAPTLHAKKGVISYCTLFFCPMDVINHGLKFFRNINLFLPSTQDQTVFFNYRILNPLPFIHFFQKVIAIVKIS